MSFVQRNLSVTFGLSGGKTFSESGTNQVTISNQRISVHATNVGTPTGASLQMTIYGMTLSLMNQLSTLGQKIILVPRDTVLVQAGDMGGQLSNVFAGTILNAYFDGRSAPETKFIVTAQSGLADATFPTPPVSFAGSTDVATMMQGIAAKMVGSNGGPLTFENNNVNVRLSNPYYGGTLVQQARAIARAAGIGMDISNDTLSIWPGGGHRNTPTMVTLSPKDGSLVGYPNFVAQGIEVRALFNPSLKYHGLFKVQDSQLTPANATWAIFYLDHSLESQTPNGDWFSIIGGFNSAFEEPIRALTQ